MQPNQFPEQPQQPAQPTSPTPTQSAAPQQPFASRPPNDPLGSPMTTYTPTYPQTPAPSSKRKKITLIIAGIAILLAATVGGIAYEVTKNVKQAPAAAGEESQKSKKAAYFSEQSIQSLQDKITAAPSLIELENTVNDTIAKEPSAKPGKTLDSLGVKITLTQSTADRKSGFKNFAGSYVIPKESDLALVKKAVAVFVGEYTKYPKEFSGGFMNNVLFGMKVTVGGNGESVVGGSTVYQSTLLSVEDLAKDSSEAEREQARRLVNHEAWHAHDAVILVNRSVEIKDKEPSLSISDAIKRASKERNDAWDALNSDGSASYTKLPYLSADTSYITEKPKAGFLTANALRNQYEDRATIFEYLSNETLRAKLNALGSNDPVIKKKINYVVKDISDYSIDGANEFLGR